MVTKGSWLGPLKSSAAGCLVALALSPLSALSQTSPDIIWQSATNSDRINTCLFSHDGSQFIAGSSDRLINIWNASNGTLLQTLNASATEVHESSIESLAMSPDGTKLVSVNYKTAKLWKLPAGTVQVINAHSDWVVGCAFSPTGTMFATASFDSSVKVWSSAGALLKTFNMGVQQRCCVFSPDGSMLASAGGDNVVTIRKTSDWSVVHTLTDHTSSIYSIAWSANGAYIATGSYDQTAKVWNVADGSLRFTVGNNGGNIYGVAFSPDSATVAIATGEGNTIKLARTSDGAVTRTFNSNTPQVQCIAYSPQGTIGYGRIDRTVVVARATGGTTGGTAPPAITLTSPANNSTLATGSDIQMTATASAGAGITKVQFFVNGTSVATDTATPFTATYPSAANGRYTIQAVVTAKDGRTASASATVTVSTPQAETTPPHVYVRGPANGARLLTNNPVLFGTATDNVAVARVLVSVNSGDFQQADGGSSWQEQLSLAPGLNTIQVKAVDTSGNESPVVTWKFTYVVSSQLTVTTDGTGVVIPKLSGQFIEVGQRRVLTAIPGAGYVFNGWSGDMQSNSPTIVFTMQQDLTLQANFIPNPFIPVMGTYNGLISSDSPDIDHVGSFRAAVTSSGAFSAMLYLGKQVFSFAGKFTGDGNYSTTLRRSALSFDVRLHLHVDDDSDQLTGEISDGSTTATITSDRLTWNARSNPASPGRYTVLIPGGENADEPQGAGYGTVMVTTSGSVVFTGRLSDGTPVSRATYMAKDNSWPMFAWTGAGNESISGQIMIEDTPGTSDMDGVVNWYRRQSRSVLYPNGFSVASSLVGSSFTPQPRGFNVLSLDGIEGNVSVAIGGGDTDGETDFTGTLDTANRFTSDDLGAQMKFRMTLSNANGMMSGSFLDPATGRFVPFFGVVFQKQNIAAGYWIGSSLSGYTVVQGN
jgi:uncharacterized repeat protein (TIGR02543 family)